MVTRTTVGDQKMLEFLLGCLQSMQHDVLRLKPKGILRVEAYMEATFAPHAVSKSHIGAVIFIGGAFDFAALRKKKWTAFWLFLW